MYSPLFVTLMGIGTVFFGLICIIVLTTIMGSVLKSNAKPAAPRPLRVPRLRLPLLLRSTPPRSRRSCSRHRGGHRGPRPQRFPYADHQHQQNLIILGEKTS